MSRLSLACFRSRPLAALLAHATMFWALGKLAVHRILTLVGELTLLTIAIAATELALSGLDHDHLKGLSSGGMTSDSSAGALGTR